MSRRFGILLSGAAAAQPDKAALWVCSSNELCWAALKARVDATVSALRTLLRFHPWCRVGIAISGGVNLVVAELACSVLGLGFVPLDPSLPRARLLYLCENASIGCVVVDEASGIAFEAASGMTVCLQGAY